MMRSGPSLVPAAMAAITRFGRRGLILALLTLSAACSGPQASCDLVPLARAPLEVRNRLLTVQAGINGQWVTMLVDTGAERTLLTEDTVKRLGLTRDPRFVSTSGGVGGVSSNADVRVDGLILGETRFPFERLAVNRLAAGVPFDGLLGADVLLAFDLDLDVPGRAMTLYRVRRCLDSDPPWPHEAVPIMGVTAVRDRMMIPIEVDGLTATALLDTGAQISVIGGGMARRLGLTPQILAADPVLTMRGVGTGSTEARIHRFRQVRIGPIAWQNVPMPVAPGEFGSADALIGQDFLRDRRVWLSFPTRRLFISQHGHEMLMRP